ncbi:hypothetical protein PQJ75_13825 [Rhodoplanes sp. TEM]|uniref:Uncharacterized protein n=1 Tax=Rhodoplanes tepidamans TaxID=200616 RepID=A0ABT5JG16_RHOTP|nr:MULTISPECIES: hypothetical protein [Rhodoplanes]MDC7787970.1 hypothetical protein [Rhodoplanes tepidamans]MDC7984810.1 hypothetical protein [Rhodoplanes sp. TEM]MDQ0358399.1 hypothetical protein [Rhodoplanes tepidamans]
MSDGTPFADEQPEPDAARSDYHEGRQAFLAGVPVGTVIARLQCESLDTADADLDYVCGFADAALDALRRASGVACNLSGPIGA